MTKLFQSAGPVKSGPIGKIHSTESKKKNVFKKDKQKKTNTGRTKETVIPIENHLSENEELKNQPTLNAKTANQCQPTKSPKWLLVSCIVVLFNIAAWFILADETTLLRKIITGMIIGNLMIEWKLVSNKLPNHFVAYFFLLIALGSMSAYENARRTGWSQAIFLLDTIFCGGMGMLGAFVANRRLQNPTRLRSVVGSTLASFIGIFAFEIVGQAGRSWMMESYHAHEYPIDLVAP